MIENNNGFLSKLYQFFTSSDQIKQFAESSFVFLIKIFIALILFYILRYLMNFFINRYDNLKKHSTNKSLHTFSRSILRMTLNFVILMICLMVLGVKGAAFAGLLGGAGLGIGLALKDTLSNFAGGMILIIFKAYDVGDLIEIDGQIGEVQGINVFATTLNTRDNRKILIPNGLVTSTHILNYNRNKIRRVDMLFGIAYEADFREGISILTKIAESHPKIIQKIDKTIRLRELGDSSVNLVFRVWCKSTDYWDVYYDVMEAAKTEFDINGISIPFPQMDVHLHTNPENVEKDGIKEGHPREDRLI
ncbi:MAG: mechanosensitive ion channel [Psychrilyobacter sp.]|nr:mechanosensitive ion channel [Psychrilyobacter sp.]